MSNQDIERIEMLLEQMIRQQEEKLFMLARRYRSTATIDDLRQPHDVPELDENPAFQFEDGLLAGLRSALMAVRAETRKSGHSPG
jgi:hypothetical protein